MFVMENCIIDRVMEELKNEMKGNEAFLSEGDFQYSFAKTVEKLGGSKVVIEYPYDLDGARRHADVSFVYDGKRYFVDTRRELQIRFAALENLHILHTMLQRVTPYILSIQTWRRWKA